MARVLRRAREDHHPVLSVVVLTATQMLVPVAVAVLALVAVRVTLGVGVVAIAGTPYAPSTGGSQKLPSVKF